MLVAMSGGVDSSVAAARLLAQGHEVTGVTLKLWGGDSDSGCCSVADVEDARRVAQQLDLAHYVFNLTEEFDGRVVDPYVAAYAAGRTPNPCVECNRSIKWGLLLERCRAMGFDALATGHHARVERDDAGRSWIRRGADPAKDQSYVLSVLPGDAVGDTLLPVGDLTKAEVRERAASLGLRTATKAESMDVCFIRRDERGSFLQDRLPAAPGVVVDVDGLTRWLGLLLCGAVVAVVGGRHRLAAPLVIGVVAAVAGAQTCTMPASTVVLVCPAERLIGPLRRVEVLAWDTDGRRVAAPRVRRIARAADLGIAYLLRADGAIWSLGNGFAGGIFSPSCRRAFTSRLSSGLPGTITAPDSPPLKMAAGVLRLRSALGVSPL